MLLLVIPVYSFLPIGAIQTAIFAGRPCQEWQLPPSKLGRRKKPQLTRGGTHDRVNHRRFCKLLEDYVYMFNSFQHTFCNIHFVCVCVSVCVCSHDLHAAPADMFLLRI